MTTLTPPWWFYTALLSVIGLILFDLSNRGPIFGRWPKLRRMSVFVMYCLVCFSYPGWGVYNQIISDYTPKYTEFPSLDKIQLQAPGIGNPTSQVITAQSFYIERHDKGALVWFELPPKDPQQPYEESNQRLIRLTDYDTAVMVDEPHLFYKIPTDELSQKLLYIPTDCPHSFGGLKVGVLWVDHPDYWKTLGCRVWSCYGNRDSIVRIQIFDNGYVLDGLPAMPGMQAPVYQLFIITGPNKSSWTTIASPTEKTDCLTETFQ